MSAFAVTTALRAGTTTQVVVDPYTGPVYVESSETASPLYEGTFQLKTEYIIGSALAEAPNDVGQRVTKEEIAEPGNAILEFWQNCCCYTLDWRCPRWRESLKFGVTVRDPKRYWETPKTYTLFTISHRSLWDMGYAQAWGLPYSGARRAYVTQIGQLKILSVIRSIGLLQMERGCPSSADFAIDVWVSIYPASVDLILRARRYPLWP